MGSMLWQHLIVSISAQQIHMYIKRTVSVFMTLTYQKCTRVCSIVYLKKTKTEGITTNQDQVRAIRDDWLNTINLSWLGHKLLTKIFRGIAILVKMAWNRRHQIVSVPMSHTFVPVGKVTVKSSLVKRRPWNLPSGLSKNAKNNFNFWCVWKNWVMLMGERMKVFIQAIQ